MRHQPVLRTLALLLAPVLVAATPSSPDSFTILVEFPPSVSALSVPVYCTGCDWHSGQIECPAGPHACAAILTKEAQPNTAAGLGSVSPQDTQPIGWLGVAIAFQHQVVSSQDGRKTAAPVAGNVVVEQVPEGSPASAAGFRRGDLVREFNYSPIKSPADLFELVRAQTPGQAFHALVERNGELVTLLGTIGEGAEPRAEASGARERRTFGAAARLGELAPFRLRVESPGALKMRCLQGCSWSRVMMVCKPNGAPSCPLLLDQNGTAAED